MHVLVIHQWRENDPLVAKTVADSLGMLVFDVRQRVAGGGPVVISTYAEQSQAETRAETLKQSGIPTLVLDPAALHAISGPFQVRQFKLDAGSLQIETSNGQSEQLPYAEILLMISAISVGGRSEGIGTLSERKFSLGKTLLAGGIPMTKKVKHEVKTNSEERDELLYLVAPDRPAVILACGALNYAGLGSAMQMSRPLNFSYLKTELIRRAPQAVVDERLLKRAGQARLLGPSLNPDIYLGLACEILTRSLLHGTGAGV
jgi:hypothetical protein